MSLNVALLEESFERIKPHGPAFVANFYTTLFTRYPETQALFAATDMAEQQQKLLASLVLVIENLRRPEVLSEALGRLGTRHAAFGTQPAHYDHVGAALLQTFADQLGSDWTPELQQSWADAYAAITSLMLQGTAASPAPTVS